MRPLPWSRSPAPDASWEPVLTCPAQTPASVGLGQRGTAFQPDIGSPRSLREARTRGAGRPQPGLSRPAARAVRRARSTGDGMETIGPSAGGAQKAPFSVLNGEVSSGFLSPDLRLVVLTEEELFAKGARHKTATQEQSGHVSLFARRSEHRRFRRPMQSASRNIRGLRGSRSRTSTVTFWCSGSPGPISSMCRSTG